MEGILRAHGELFKVWSLSDSAKAIRLTQTWKPYLCIGRGRENQSKFPSVECRSSANLSLSLLLTSTSSFSLKDSPLPLSPLPSSPPRPSPSLPSLPPLFSSPILPSPLCSAHYSSYLLHTNPDLTSSELAPYQSRATVLSLWCDRSALTRFSKHSVGYAHNLAQSRCSKYILNGYCVLGIGHAISSFSKVPWGRPCLCPFFQTGKLRLREVNLLRVTLAGRMRAEMRNQLNSRPCTFNYCAILPPKYLWKTYCSILFFINLNKTDSLATHLCWPQPLVF